MIMFQGFPNAFLALECSSILISGPAFPKRLKFLTALKFLGPSQCLKKIKFLKKYHQITNFGRLYVNFRLS